MTVVAPAPAFAALHCAGEPFEGGHDYRATAR
jgi:hypothetical protein